VTLQAFDALAFVLEPVQVRAQQALQAGAIAIAAHGVRDLFEREPRAPRTPHQARALQVFVGVLAIAFRRARCLGHQAALLVQAQRGGADPDAARRFADIDGMGGGGTGHGGRFCMRSPRKRMGKPMQDRSPGDPVVSHARHGEKRSSTEK
jgi:hypothetical protein